MPNLDLKGKVLFADFDKISFNSIGTGGIFRALKMNSLETILDNEKIEYIHFSDPSNLTGTSINPVLLGFMDLFNKVVITECSNAGKSSSSARLESFLLYSEAQGSPDIYYPSDLELAKLKGFDIPTPRLISSTLNFYTRKDHLIKNINSSKDALGRFRAHFKNIYHVSIGGNYSSPNNSFTFSKYNAASFEIDIHNLFAATQNDWCVFIRNSEHDIIFGKDSEKRELMSLQLSLEISQFIHEKRECQSQQMREKPQVVIHETNILRQYIESCYDAQFILKNK